MRNPFLIGPTCYLRALEPEDAPLIAAANNDPEVRVSFFTHTPLSVHLAAERARGYYAPGSDHYPLAICLRRDNQAVGLTGLVRVDLVSGAAVFYIVIVDATVRGRGIGVQTTQLVLDYAFNVLNLHRVQLHVWVENEAGIQAYRKAGFVEEGRLREAMKHNGKWCDFLVMGVLEAEWRSRRKSEVRRQRQ